MKASPKILAWYRPWAKRPCAVSKARTWQIRSPFWPAPSTSSAMAERPSARARKGTGLDQGDTRVDEATLRRIHLQGYISTVKAGVASIMPSYSSWNGVKVSGDKHLLTDILKQELGFQGFLISDYNAIDQINPDYKKAIGISINAGMDMVHGAGALQGIHHGFEATGGRRRGADVAHRRRRDPHPPRQIRHGADGSQPLATGRPQPGEDFRLARTSRGGAAGGARIAGRAEEPEQRAAAGEDRRAHPRRRQERGRSGQPVRRLDHRLAGQERPGYVRRHDAAGRHQVRRLGQDASHVL